MDIFLTPEEVKICFQQLLEWYNITYNYDMHNTMIRLLNIYYLSDANTYMKLNEEINKLLPPIITIKNNYKIIQSDIIYNDKTFVEYPFSIYCIKKQKEDLVNYKQKMYLYVKNIINTFNTNPAKLNYIYELLNLCLDIATNKVYFDNKNKKLKQCNNAIINILENILNNDIYISHMIQKYNIYNYIYTFFDAEFTNVSHENLIEHLVMLNIKCICN